MTPSRILHLAVLTVLIAIWILRLVSRAPDQSVLGASARCAPVTENTLFRGKFTVISPSRSRYTSTATR
jgi:hypothetical protein